MGMTIDVAKDSPARALAKHSVSIARGNLSAAAGQTG
jgi:hypothetical protein